MKTTEQIKAEVKSYLQKTNLHLFKNGDTFMKIIPFTENEVEYYATVKITESGKITISVTDIYKWGVSPSTKHYLKRNAIFPCWSKPSWVGVKHFKKIDRLIYEISSSISSSNEKNLKLIADLEKFGLTDLSRPTAQ